MIELSLIFASRECLGIFRIARGLVPAIAVIRRSATEPAARRHHAAILVASLGWICAARRSKKNKRHSGQLVKSAKSLKCS
jgi:hypothetical protein